MDKLRFETLPDGIVILTFNRPEARNALDLETMRRFAHAVYQLPDMDTLRAVVITGAGADAFCSGGDLAELSGYQSAEDAREMIALMGDALLALECLPVPVIAAINGYALGGGSEIAVACDLRIVDEAVQMGFVQVNMALTPGWGAGQRLLRLVGYGKAMELLLKGTRLKADELTALGLANAVAPRGEALNMALEWARGIAAAPPKVVQGIKTLLQAGLRNPYTQALNIERELFPSLWADEAHLQAVDKFLNWGKKTR
jgi:enoyl-CoA hydratase/carnithine racemase